MLLVIPILAVLCAPALWMILGRPRFLDNGKAPERASAISIVIPARDEEGNIGCLLDSIAEQEVAPCEVIVVDDGSSDRTAEVARGKGARVLACPPLAEGWKGKPWACSHGAGEARGEWLLFLDADTRLESGAMAKLASLTEDADSVHSVCPYHRIRRPYEQLSAFFNLIMVAGVNAFGLRPDPSGNVGLFGQCLLISQKHYEEVGGHEPVRAEVLENFHLARHLAERGIGRSCLMGRGAVSMRMFPGGFGELCASWKKGFAAGASNAAPRALLLVSLWLTGAMLALVGGVLAVTPFASDCFRLVAVAVYALYAFQSLRAFRLVGNFSLLNAVLFPCSLLFYQALFFASIIERRLGIKTRWKGRHVD